MLIKELKKLIVPTEITDAIDLTSIHNIYALDRVGDASRIRIRELSPGLVNMIYYESELEIDLEQLRVSVSLNKEDYSPFEDNPIKWDRDRIYSINISKEDNTKLYFKLDSLASTWLGDSLVKHNIIIPVKLK